INAEFRHFKAVMMRCIYENNAHFGQKSEEKIFYRCLDSICGGESSGLLHFPRLAVGEMRNYARVIPYAGTGKGFTPGLTSLYNDDISCSRKAVSGLRVHHEDAYRE